MNKACYLSLLAEEEKYRLAEQSALLASISENGSTGKSKLSALRRAGLAMTGLELSGRSSGSGGRILLELTSGIAKASDDKAARSSGCCFRSGELVRIMIGGKVLETIGTVERRNSSSHSVTISLPSEAESEELELISSSRMALVKIADDIGIFDKMRDNLKQILEVSEKEEGIISEMKRFLTTDDYKRDERIKDDVILSKPLESRFNNEQEMAIESAIKMICDRDQNLLLIHGPPGTGKTSVLVEIIRRIRESKRPLKILICGPSNLSVDNVVERVLPLLEESSMSILRIGHPARVLESCQGSTLDFWCENSDEGRLLSDVQSEIDRILKIDLPRCKSREERRACFGELKLLRQERRKRMKDLEAILIGRAEIVACTLSTACGRKLKSFGSGAFDVAIVDEAGQSLLPEILVAPLKAKKLILVGDHFQLPPTVMCPEIKEKLQVSLFEHLSREEGDGHKLVSKVMLKEQYRMNRLIMQWSNETFYGDELRANESVADWRINGADGADEEIGQVLIFYDTCGFDLWEDVESESGLGKGILVEESSKFNVGEAKIVLDHLKKLKQHGMFDLGLSVAVISPYSAQVNYIKDALWECKEISAGDIEVNSIDGFQGREKDIVILSLVRSNSEGSIGFLNEMRRLNVAMTRAKKQLVVIGDSETLCRDEKLKGLIEYLNENAAIMFPE